MSRTVHIKRGCHFEGDFICIGNDVFINHDCRFYSYRNEASFIQIEDNVTIAMGVTFCTQTHKIGGAECRASKGTSTAPIIVEQGSWIGSNVTVLPGVRVGRGCVIAAGAVVTNDCIENGMYAGVPAKLKKVLNE